MKRNKKDRERDKRISLLQRKEDGILFVDLSKFLFLRNHYAQSHIFWFLQQKHKSMWAESKGFVQKPITPILIYSTPKKGSK